MEQTAGTVAQSEYAQKRREVLALANDLRAMGAESEIGIPRIAVIGRQSAGKSSLVEAVAGISVPRDSDTCTRCPMECTISTSVQWSCKISLRVEGQPVAPFSPELTSKAEVEIWIRRAQAAALSPHRRAGFLGSSYAELRELAADGSIPKFTGNIVVVHIQDPEGTDLSFIDLPGLISNEEGDMIDLVENLVKHYIQDAATIILVTIPASDDMALQKAAKLAREADPKGERTIGVITKPDYLPPGASGMREMWQNILQGKSHQLQLGYYSVRLPDDEERKKGISRAEVERLAMQFFRDNEPWNRLLHLNRLGIAFLVADISKVLMRIIHDSLPVLKEKVDLRLKECIEELTSLPEPVTVDPTTEILSRVARFCGDMKETIHLQKENNTFIHRNHAIYQRFKIAIRKTEPDFRPFPNPDPFVKPGPPRSWSDDEDAEDAEGEEVSAIVAKPIGLYDVRRLIKGSIGWELPHNIPYEAKVRLCRRFIDCWDAPTNECFNDAASILEKLVDVKIKEHFGRFKALEQHIGPLIRREVESCSRHGHRSVAGVLEREREPYFTQNGHYLESVREHWLSHYRSIRRDEDEYKKNKPVPAVSAYEASYPMETLPAVTRALRALGELGYKQLSEEDFVRLHPPDRFEDEMAVMADVRAYFQVAYKRMIDNVPMSIHKDLNQRLCNRMQDFLLEELDVGAPGTAERFQELLVEDPHIVAQRKELIEREKRLLEIQAKLHNFFAGV